MTPRGKLVNDEPLAPHTSWRVGGPADRWFEPADRDDLVNFVRSLPEHEPILWVGLGSNLLVRDGGVRGTVISLHGALDAVELESGAKIRAEAGVHCARLAKFAQKEQRAGLGFMAGIPGTVGGALAMNAGAWGGETWPQVSAAEVLYRNGRSEWLRPDAFTFSYRHVELPAKVCGFLAARFEVADDADGSHARYSREALAKRKATQPVGKPSAGSTFRNPPNDHAARLIESCGLKGHRIGGAHVSTHHANFIITEDGATAADVESLIHHIQRVVFERAHVALQTEVRIVGEQGHA
ncbi:MAG TPA: UDP-N-acetylmuramate dehydrogenase [Verrucomicrobiae bacterium]|nr:UDP-N-acetylmuramate dehydrogenase [Verrucomicrobiae bacterium]